MVHWSFISILMHLFAADPHSTTGLLYLSRYHNMERSSDSVFYGLGLTDFKCMVNASLLALVGLSLLVSH